VDDVDRRWVYDHDDCGFITSGYVSVAGFDAVLVDKDGNIMEDVS
jgi:hypothetical protein